MDYVKKTNDVMVRLFNVVLKLEEKAIQESSTHNISIREMHILDAIGANGARTMGETAEMLQIQVSTLTTAINKLVKKGYVERFRIPTDRRIVKIKLTKDGVSAVKEHEDFHNQMIKNAIQELSEEEMGAFLSSLDNINDFLDMQMTSPRRRPEDFRLGPICLGKYIVPKGIFQGGMGIGISGHNLAAAVSKEGGLGVIGGADIGFREPDYQKDPMKANQRALKREIQLALSQVEGVEGRGPIGVNLPYSLENYSDYVSAALEAGVEVIVSGAGLPVSLPALCRDSQVALIPVVSSLRATKIIMRNWEKKYKRKPDAIIFESVFAGGQLGYKESQLVGGRGNYYKTISDIRGEIGDIPLIVAGGILTLEEGQRAFIYGGDGIQIATPFVTTYECDAPDSFKNAYLNCKENDVTIVNISGSMPCRAIRNKFVDQLGVNPSFSMEEALIRAAKGDMEQGLIFCGSKAHALNEIKSVRSVMREFFP